MCLIKEEAMQFCIVNCNCQMLSFVRDLDILTTEGQYELSTFYLKLKALSIKVVLLVGLKAKKSQFIGW